ncbi:proteasome maturation factor UMP1-domain-containing protein [Neurospora tetraspora]|uniref:Proteasome maturation factor UMP1-domain-containing protein n=1 Tax=Neurospora tetraspora TaxID=94610 RepID=A0AAE0J8N6_9PEZI|nr:proteasome maturation factor UMP1-domain-containing protein [Neurospora tetraspora]
MSLRIVPADSHTTTFTHLRSIAAPSAPGLHDTLRSGLAPNPLDSVSSSSGASTASAVPISSHPLESRLKQWEATREALRMETLRRTFGMAEPIRRQMELKIVRDGEWKPLALGGSVGTLGGMGNVHEEILMGRDGDITWEDVFTGEEGRAEVSVQEEMERKLRISA